MFGFFSDKKEPPKQEKPKPKADPKEKPKAEPDALGLKKSLKDREKAAGLKKGGMVRGCGKATKGYGKGTMR
jgi:hypothetical protein